MNDRTVEPLPLPDRWKDLSQTVGSIEARSIAHHHLQSCQSQIKLNFRYALTASESENSIGELNLILNDSLEVIDENWLIDIRSPYVISV